MITIRKKVPLDQNTTITATINTISKQNPIFKILNPLEKYFSVSETQTADFIFPNKKILILFLQLSYIEKYPHALEEQLNKVSITEKEKDYLTKILIFLIDKEDSMDYLLEVQMKLIPYNFKLIPFQTFEEVAEFFKKLNELQ